MASTLTIDAAEASLLNDLKKNPALGDVRATRVTLPDGEAVLFTMMYTGTTADGSSYTAPQRWYVVIRDNAMYTVTFNGFDPNPSACLKDAEAMIATLEIGP